MIDSYQSDFVAIVQNNCSQNFPLQDFKNIQFNTQKDTICLVGNYFKYMYFTTQKEYKKNSEILYELEIISKLWDNVLFNHTNIVF